MVARQREYIFVCIHNDSTEQKKKHIISHRKEYSSTGDFTILCENPSISDILFPFTI